MEKQLNLKPVGNFFVAEYSRKQDCFNVSTMYKMVEHNVGIILRQVDVDYIPFGFFGTYEQASDACNKMRKEIGDCNSEFSVIDAGEEMFYENVA